MARKAKKQEIETETIEETKPVALRVRREHIEFAHAVELRWDDGKLIEARMQDARHTSTIGAKTVERILSEVGARVPVNDEVLEVTFSPHNGEIVAVLPVNESAENLE